MLNALLYPNLKHIAVLIILGALASLISAWFIQYALGYAPCQLCYAQRWPYYLAATLGLAAWLALRRGPDTAARLMVATTGIIMLGGACLAVYHSGVEWKFWPGPSSCTTAISMSSSVTDLLAQAKQARIVPCDQPPFRLFGLSPANYNVLISLAFAAFCFYGLRINANQGTK